MEHLLEAGIEKIIRIGGRSKSAALEGKNIRIVSQSEGQTKSERYQAGVNIRKQETQQDIIKSLLRIVRATGERTIWKAIDAYLGRHHPDIHKQFSRVDDDGFELVSLFLSYLDEWNSVHQCTCALNFEFQAGDVEPFDLWLKQGSTTTTDDQTSYTIEDLCDIAKVDVYTISAANRRRLADHWILDSRTTVWDDLHEAVQSSKDSQQSNQRIYDDIDRRVLQNADIIGVTTTGLARKISALQHLNAKVIICEEAGEVLEAHMLSTLLRRSFINILCSSRISS